MGRPGSAQRSNRVGRIRPEITRGEPVVDRSSPRAGRSSVGGLGILVGAIAIAALLLWSGSVGGPAASPSPTALVPTAFELPTPSLSGGPSGSDPPTSVPSDTPLPTPVGTVYVEPSVVDRAGVPSALYDKDWIVGGSANQVGQVGKTARIVLPANENIIGADAGWVASYEADPDSNAAISGPNGTTIIVRDIRTGAVVRTVDSGIHVSYGVMTGSLLFWIGRTLPFEAPTSTDAGVWVLDVADPTATPQAIIAPADLDATYGPHAGRSYLKLTDRGRAIVTSVGVGLERATQVIDVAGRSLRMTVPDRIAVDLAGQTALVLRPDGVLLLDLDSGRQIGPQLTTDSVMQSVVGEREVFVQHGVQGKGVYITAIDLQSGATRDILHQPRGVTTSLMDARLSAPALLVLLDGDWEIDSAGRLTVAISLLDPATGELQPDAFTLGAP